jgi:hypothetical protein
MVMLHHEWPEPRLVLIYRLGVLWSGDHLFPGTVETLELLRSQGSFGPDLPFTSI